jgi:hypothetical protein
VLEARELLFYGGNRFMAQFHVRDAFAIQDKAVFVLAGFAVEGEIAPGMLVRLPFQGAAMMTADIDHIQRLQRPDGDIVCLCIHCNDPKEAALWEAFKLKDRIIEVIKRG